MNKVIGIVLGIVAIGGITFFAVSGDKTGKQEGSTESSTMRSGTPTTEVRNGMPVVEEVTKENETIEQDAVVMDEPTKQDEGAVMETSGEPMKTADPAMMKAGSYEPYSAQKIALAETGKVVLFFHAAWCPSCRALNSDIEKNVSAIPSNVTILKTDYDQETDLKKKYGVTYQHTMVQVDKNGNLIKKWSGGSKLENLLSQIQ